MTKNITYFLMIMSLFSCGESINHKKLNEKRMIEIADSVYNSKTQTVNKKPNNEIKNNTINQLMGRWDWEAENGNFFQLTFSNNGEVAYQAYRMPFEEILTWKQNGDVIELYYKGISEGTIETIEKNRNKSKCSELVAKCNLKSENKMYVEVIQDMCGYMDSGRFNLSKGTSEN